MSSVENQRLAGLALRRRGNWSVVALVAALGCAYAAHVAIPAIGVLLWAIFAGAVAGGVLRRHSVSTDAVYNATTALLRVGVALLGLTIAIGELTALGLEGIAIAVATVAGTLAATIFVGRRLGVARDMAVLIATGSAICGASAIAAAKAVTTAREEDVAYAIGAVTALGTVAMLAVPLLAHTVFGLGDIAAGLWAGASIHEVAQVAAAGAAISPAALKAAMLIKLLRVVLLAPAIAALSVWQGGSPRLVTVPGFVLAFVALIAVRNVLPVPAEAVDAAQSSSTLLLAAGLAGVGLHLHPRRLVSTGMRPLALAAIAALVASAVALAGVLTLS